MLAYQLMGVVAIGIGFIGTWLAATRRSGWLVCVASSAMWFPALVSGNQWAAVANCALSIGICLRNFQAQTDVRPVRTIEQERRAPALEHVVETVEDRPLALATA